MKMTEAQLKEILGKGHCKIADDSSAVHTTNLEPAPRNNPLEKKENPRDGNKI